MITIKDKIDCCGCGACAQVCPVGCIRMEADAEGFRYPEVDKTKCIQCGLCEKVCPILRGGVRKGDTPKAYAAYNLNEDIRMASSSGGVFSLIGEHVLSRQGIIYGAAMEDVGTVKHIRVTSLEELEMLRGSKYVQSDTGNVYIQAKQDLDAGKTVLFTGTPCQIEGLRSFLNKEYENLICMDIICHGVPSPMVWEKYVAHREHIAGHYAIRAFFRDKTNGWKNYEVGLTFSNDTVYSKTYGENSFMRAFLQDLCLRPSCYQCRFKTPNRVSDITVADFWGIENVCPEMDDDKGTSLVILHSRKGEQIFHAIRGGMRYREVEFESAIKGNPAMIRSVKRPEERDGFMRDIQTGSFDEVVNQYAKKQRSNRDVVRKILVKLRLLKLAKTVKRFLRTLIRQE